MKWTAILLGRLSRACHEHDLSPEPLVIIAENIEGGALANT